MSGAARVKKSGVHAHALRDDLRLNLESPTACLCAGRRAPAPNLDGEFIDELAHQVTSAVNKPVVSSVEACVVNAFDLRDEPLGLSLIHI